MLTLKLKLAYLLSNLGWNERLDSEQQKKTNKNCEKNTREKRRKKRKHKHNDEENVKLIILIKNSTFKVWYVHVFLKFTVSSRFGNLFSNEAQILNWLLPPYLANIRNENALLSMAWKRVSSELLAALIT